MKPGHPAPTCPTSSSFRLLTEPASLKRLGVDRGADRDAGFRLLTEPASLKRNRVVRAGYPPSPFPAPHRAGLIEATTRPSSSSSASGFPAPHRAGLIEAWAPPRTGAQGRTGSFRLLTEPASLKRPGRRPAGGAPRKFPAPHRAGLIEAGSRAQRTPPRAAFPAPHRAGLIEASGCTATTRIGSRFPAPHRAGLIEAGVAGTHYRRRRAVCFRLLTEPASLKQADCGPSTESRHGRFPAPHRAGLIEARRRRNLPGWPHSEFPAPHRAGLIEANHPSHRADPGRTFPAPHRAGLIEAWDIHGRDTDPAGCFRLLTEPASLKRICRCCAAHRADDVSGSSQSRPH